MYDSIQVGKKIKELRNKKKFTQKTLSKKVGIPQSSLSKFENGENIFNINKIGIITDVLGIFLDDLFHDYLIKYSKSNTETYYDIRFKDLLFTLEEQQLVAFDNFIDYYLECQLLLKNKKY